MTEVFDSPYEVSTSGDQVTAVKDALKNDGITQSVVYQNASDPKEFFIEICSNGAWEVHHNYIDDQGKFVSGLRLNRNSGANPRFISTALKLYRDRLNKGQSIRIVSTPELWTLYKKAINHILVNNKDQYNISAETHTTDKDGRQVISVDIKPRSKLESLNRLLNKK
jgi:hypothetical protein